MAKIDIKKMSVIALQQDREKILSILQRLGCAEVVNIKEKEDKQPDPERLREYRERVSELNLCLNFLSNYTTVKKTIFDQKPVYTSEEMEEIGRSERVNEIIDESRAIEKKLAALKSEQLKLENTAEALKPWEGLGVAVEELGETESTVFQAGTIAGKKYGEFREKLAELTAVHLEEVSADREEYYLLLAYHKGLGKEVERIAGESGWARQELPEVKGTPAEGLQSLREEMTACERERDELESRARELAGDAQLIEAAYDYYSILSERAAAAGKLAATERTINLEGWVPENEVEEVAKSLEQEVDGLYISFSDPEPDDDVPTVVENPAVVEPYELITDLYSPPGKNDIDPNIYMTPFFFLFFGMMVSDAGYGIVLMGLSFLALKKLKPSGQAGKLLRLIFLGGVSTFIWGAIYGGWFGELIKLPPIWINPLENPIAILILSFAMGGVQIFVGLALQGYKNIRNGRLLDAVYDQGFWMVFLAGFVFFAFPETGFLAKYVVTAGALGLVLTQGRDNKNFIKRIGSGILSLYDVTSYLSDVLSYSRVMALGMATGVVASVVNTMAELVGVNIIGYIAMAVILVVGHVFNVAINSLGAYVHTSRLQYVEFFSKFYQGGGRSLEPFAIRTKFTNYRYGEENV